MIRRYYIALRLLKSGATVVAVTRFPHDAALRYKREIKGRNKREGGRGEEERREGNGGGNRKNQKQKSELIVIL